MPASDETRVGPPGPQPLERRLLAKLDDICFCGLFALGTALVSPPLATIAGVAGCVLLAIAWIVTGRATSPDSPDDIQFTRIFLGATLLVYAGVAATQWSIGLWVLMLSGMFLLHCARNLMIVEKVIVRAAPPLPAVEPRDGQEVLESAAEMLQAAADVREATGGDVDPARQALDRARAAARSYFLVRQRGALHLTDATLSDLPALERELTRARQAQGEATLPDVRAAREREVQSLERLLIAAQRPAAGVGSFRAAVAGVEDALGDIGERLAEREALLAGEDSAEIPLWFWTALAVLEAALAKATEELEGLERREPE